MEKSSKFTQSRSLLWKVSIVMPDVSRCVTTAFRISGPVDKLDLPGTIYVRARNASQQVWLHLPELKKSNTREICVLRFIPGNNDEKTSYDKLFSYLNQRNIYGIADNFDKNIEDFFIVPLSSHSNIPHFLLPFDGPGLEESRADLLLAVIVKKKQKRQRTSDSSETDITNESTTAKKSRSDNEGHQLHQSCFIQPQAITTEKYLPPHNNLSATLMTEDCNEYSPDRNNREHPEPLTDEEMIDVDSYIASRLSGYHFGFSNDNNEGVSTLTGRDRIGSNTGDVLAKDASRSYIGATQGKDTLPSYTEAYQGQNTIPSYTGFVQGKSTLPSYTEADQGQKTIPSYTGFVQGKSTLPSYTGADQGQNKIPYYTGFVQGKNTLPSYTGAGHGKDTIGATTGVAVQRQVITQEGQDSQQTINGVGDNMNNWSSFFSRNRMYADNSFNRKHGRVGKFHGMAPVRKPQSWRKKKGNSSECYKLMFYLLVVGCIVMFILYSCQIVFLFKI